LRLVLLAELCTSRWTFFLFLKSGRNDLSREQASFLSEAFLTFLLLDRLFYIWKRLTEHLFVGSWRI
jgi:hypothetical protein